MGWFSWDNVKGTLRGCNRGSHQEWTHMLGGLLKSKDGKCLEYNEGDSYVDLRAEVDGLGRPVRIINADACAYVASKFVCLLGAADLFVLCAAFCIVAARSKRRVEMQQYKMTLHCGVVQDTRMQCRWW